MASAPFRVKAVFEYSSPHDDDLSFPNGQIITVIDEEDADWYSGEYLDADGNKKEGLFPRNFVERYEPETPPRPSRTNRARKEKDSASTPKELESSATLEDVEHTQKPTTPYEPSALTDQTAEYAASSNANTSQPTAEVTKPPENPSEPPTLQAATKPAVASKPAPPPVAEKPASGSFRDRIAAFNRPAAPPVAPIKPGGAGKGDGYSFVKKPFVAPPPSKNAYVPPPREAPPKIYRREEDPDMVANTSRDGDTAQAQPPMSEESEDQPKPTSLKDRIALLQKQQMEQAARQAEAAQKKEKPKRPPKKRMESNQNIGNSEAQAGDEAPQNVETTTRRSTDTRDDSLYRTRSATQRSHSKETTPVTSPTVLPRDFISSGNDADHSGAGDTEDGEDTSTGREDVDAKPPTKERILPDRSAQSALETEIGDGEENADEDDDDGEEEEVDPETKRRMEIRDRMAKMSGGMGMAGMFNPFGMPSGTPKKQKSSGTSEKKSSVHQEQGSVESGTSRNVAVPMVPMPGMQRVRSPEQEYPQPEVEQDDEKESSSVHKGRALEDMADVEAMHEEPFSQRRRSEDRPAQPRLSQDRAVPMPPSNPREAPPVPIDRSVPPPPPTGSRPLPRPPPDRPVALDEGPESDDGIVPPTRTSTLKIPQEDSPRPANREVPAIPSPGRSPVIPNSNQGAQSPVSQYQERRSSLVSDQTSPTSYENSVGLARRSSRVPPIPKSNLATGSAPHNRAPPPPPPPPIDAPPSRKSTGDERNFLYAPDQETQGDSDEEVTEYDGDYDTDIAPGASHKEALKSHTRGSSLDETTPGDESSLHHHGLPSLGPPPIPTTAAPRAVPPPPPNQPPRNSRKSSDMPRNAPPPPPPPPHREQSFDKQADEYDPYSYISPRIGTSEVPATRQPEQDDDLYAVSPLPKTARPLPPQNLPSYTTQPPVPTPAVSRTIPRQSLDVQRPNTTGRRSMDAPRSSGEQGFIAGDVDLGRGSLWWAQSKVLPPVFQNRRDISYEFEQSSETGQDGRKILIKEASVLFMDYSQTTITARFSATNPADVALEQHHEPPPPRLRQDQLEDAHTKFGVHIAEGANAKQNVTVGNGSPFTLAMDLIRPLPDALLPVGVRAYGALVYANMANASVSQHDEIRAGDIITFRNTKFQGHKGTMHQKYGVEVGKPDHVAVVVDWDGTKKKVRAWEQGRESKKVKMESFKLGDLRSGEVKVWRVMARSWVRWVGPN